MNVQPGWEWMLWSLLEGRPQFLYKKEKTTHAYCFLKDIDKQKDEEKIHV